MTTSEEMLGRALAILESIARRAEAADERQRESDERAEKDYALRLDLNRAEAEAVRALRDQMAARSIAHNEACLVEIKKQTSFVEQATLAIVSACNFLKA